MKSVHGKKRFLEKEVPKIRTRFLGIRRKCVQVQLTPDGPAWLRRAPATRRPAPAPPHDAHVVGPRLSTCMPLLDTWVVGPADRQAGPAAVPCGPPVALASFFSFSKRRWRVAVAGCDATGLRSRRAARVRAVDSDPRRRWTGRGGPEAQGRPRGARVSVTDRRWTRRVQRATGPGAGCARARWSAAGHDSDSRGGGARLARTRAVALAFLHPPANLRAAAGVCNCNVASGLDVDGACCTFVSL